MAFPLKQPRTFLYNADTFYFAWEKGKLVMNQNKMRWMAGFCLTGILVCCGGCVWELDRQPSFAFPETEITEPEQETRPCLEFPHTLPGSGLVMEAQRPYNGPYWEDGSGQVVEGVAGVELYNPSDRMVDFLSVVLDCEGKKLYFFVYQLPPNSRCLVLEKARQPLGDSSVLDCRELGFRWNYQELSRIQLDYLGLGTQLTVINRDARRQDHVTVWYKRYVKEGDYYLGGIAYSAHMFFLQPQERRTITPEFYEAGNVKIVAIQLSTT